MAARHDRPDTDVPWALLFAERKRRRCPTSVRAVPHQRLTNKRFPKEKMEEEIVGKRL